MIRKGEARSIQVVIGELKEKGEKPVVAQTGPKMGMVVDEITPEMARRFGLNETDGVIVVGVDSNSPAEEAGLRPGDVILEIDQAPVTGLDAFNRVLDTYGAGDTVLLLTKRSGGTLFLTLKIGK